MNSNWLDTLDEGLNEMVQIIDDVQGEEYNPGDGFTILFYIGKVEETNQQFIDFLQKHYKDTCLFIISFNTFQLRSPCYAEIPWKLPDHDSLKEINTLKDKIYDYDSIFCHFNRFELDRNWYPFIQKIRHFLLKSIECEFCEAIHFINGYYFLHSNIVDRAGKMVRAEGIGDYYEYIPYFLPLFKELHDKNSDKFKIFSEFLTRTTFKHKFDTSKWKLIEREWNDIVTFWKQKE